MKRIFILSTTIIMMLCTTLSWADNDKVIEMHQLPTNSQNLIKHHFKGLNISIIKQDTDFLDKSYTVIFDNGARIEFNKKGEWKEIDCGKFYVPEGIIPSKIVTFIKTKYPQAKVVEIDIDDDSKGYDVELDNGITLEFNRHQELIDIDR